jgi:hypothetical protein
MIHKKIFTNEYKNRRVNFFNSLLKQYFSNKKFSSLSESKLLILTHPRPEIVEYFTKINPNNGRI